MNSKCLYLESQEGKVSKAERDLEELLEQARPWLWRLLTRWGADPEVVPDLIQEILVKTWEARRRWDPQRGFWPWLRRIAVNHYGDWQHRRSRDLLAQAQTWEESVSEENEAARNPSSEQQVLRTELQGEVQHALLQLAPKYREVLWSFYLEDWSCQEIAQSLNLTLSQVEGRLFRGRSQLRTSLGSIMEHSFPGY